MNYQVIHHSNWGHRLVVQVCYAPLARLPSVCNLYLFSRTQCITVCSNYYTQSIFFLEHAHCIIHQGYSASGHVVAIGQSNVDWSMHMTGFLVLQHSYYNLTDAVWCGYSNLCTTIKFFARSSLQRVSWSVYACFWLEGWMEGGVQFFWSSRKKFCSLFLGVPMPASSTRVCRHGRENSDGTSSCIASKIVPKYTYPCQGFIDPRSGERAYACRDGKMLVVTKNRTLPFSKACPNPPQKWAKPFS